MYAKLPQTFIPPEIREELKGKLEAHSFRSLRVNQDEGEAVADISFLLDADSGDAAENMGHETLRALLPGFSIERSDVTAWPSEPPHEDL